MDPITINTLSGVLYMEQYNDISFTIGNKLVVLIEHQSTMKNLGACPEVLHLK